MSNAVFPTLPGLMFPIKKKPNFSSDVQRSVSGREVAAAFMAYPIWDWELSYELLRETASEFQSLVGFFLARKGRFDTFLFSDPSDCTATGQSFGTGNGATTAFQLSRSLGGFSEPVYDLNGAPAIYDNGVLKVAGTDYTVNSTGVVTFTVAPAAGHSLTWTGAYYWRVRFQEDSTEFEQFMVKLWSAGKVSFSTARF